MLRAIATPGHTPDHLAYLLLVDGRTAGPVLGRVADGRRGGPHRPARRRAPRGARPGAVPGAAIADPHPARRPGRVPDARRRVVLLGPVGLGPDDHHRHRAGHQPAAEHRGRRPLRRHAARRAWAASRRTSGGSRRSTGAARASTPSSPPSLGSTSTRSAATSTTARCSSTPGRSPTSPPRTCRGRCRSSTGACSPAGSAGSSPSIVPSCSSSTRTPTGPTWSASASPSATTRCSASSTAASTPGRRPVSRSSRSRSSPPTTMSGTVLDVRQDSEWNAGHLPGALHVELGDLAADRRPRRPADGDVRARRTRHERRQHPRRQPVTATSPCSPAAPTTGTQPPASISRPRDHAHRRARGAGAARAAGEPGAVQPARRGQRAGRRDDRPGTHRPAAARRARVRAHRVHRRAHLHRRVRRGEGGHQLLRRHPVGPLRPQARARRRLDHRRAGAAAVDLGADAGAGSSPPTSCSASTRASPGPPPSS